jgi:hypothetical protein
MALVPRGLNSLPLLFLMVSNMTLKNGEWLQLQDKFRGFRTP